ncbi:MULTISPECIES: phage tail protein [Parabacteroides]|uniref:Major tail protein n=1 Tax=Myoviridae sp. ctU4n16 TaxID=2826658 RepID=A0A8S5N5J4_9CAUD|nr:MULTISPECIES: phage tail protein [Parabacteroides]MCL3854040.1 phage tail protein [Parabacteroides leei]DAD89546.1 MAG TPA: major tail protein [Myoviridae sp. ctU4n16]
MADDGSAQSASTQAWPLPGFYFKVSITNVGDLSCNEVSGLDAEYEAIEYRAGDSPIFTKLKMPGLRKSGDVTLKKGIFKDEKAMWDWFNKVKQNIIQRETVTISLLDESGSPVKTWEVTNAWPKKITVEGFKSDSNSPSMETLVLANEGVTVK